MRLGGVRMAASTATAASRIEDDIASDRRVAFNEDGIFRHYKALDI
jgi:hypothetical protein